MFINSKVSEWTGIYSYNELQNSNESKQIAVTHFNVDEPQEFKFEFKKHGIKDYINVCIYIKAN